MEKQHYKKKLIGISLGSRTRKGDREDLECEKIKGRSSPLWKGELGKIFRIMSLLND